MQQIMTKLLTTFILSTTLFVGRTRATPDFFECSTQVCGNNCNSDGCAANCTGSECGMECNGDGCAANCSGDDCGIECRSNGCAADCSGMNCGRQLSAGGGRRGAAARCSGAGCGVACMGYGCACECTGADCGCGCMSRPFDALPCYATQSCTSADIESTSLGYIQGLNCGPSFCCDGRVKVNGGCVDIVYGCTDDVAFNYDSNANTDDDTCDFDVVNGCNNPSAFNYNVAANTDDGSCFWACDVGQYRDEAGGDCIDVPADMSADLQTAETALADANTAAAELAAEVKAEKDAATAAATAAVEELEVDVQTAVTALAAANTALAAANTALAAACPTGQYRDEAGGDCQSVTERLWTIVNGQ